MEAKAEQQVLGRMREIGLSQVHAESWVLPCSWHRGPATASLVEPFSLPIPVAAYGWSGLTHNVNGPSAVVLLSADEIASHLDALVRSQRASWNGKVLLVSANSSEPMRVCGPPSTRSGCNRRACYRSASARHTARSRDRAFGAAFSGASKQS